MQIGFIMPTTVFNYKGTKLSTGGVDLQSLADKYGSPLYVYNNDHIIDNYNNFMNAFNGNATAHFAMKSNSNQAILTALVNAGCGMDIVSGGELQRAISAGCNPNKIIFSGVAKTDAEMADALNAGILQINVESVAEINQLNDVAKSLGKIAPVALRVNPNVDAGTHDKISTGKKTDKFGIDIDLAVDLYNEMQAMENIEPCGISVHIGSQLMSAKPFVESYKKVAELAETLIAGGIKLQRLDLGGGLGICYEPNDTAPDVNEYAKMVNDTVGHLNLDLHFEPGRWLVGNAGCLIGRVENVKSNDVKTFVLCDVAMNDLVRPTLYNAYHHILPLNETDETITADLVGPVCESGDYMAKDRKLAKMERGDYFAVLSAGAYGMTMADNYNTRPTPAEVLIVNGKDYLVRERQTIDELINRDIVPDIF